MIPLWVLSLLNTDVEEFLYCGRYRVFIRGNRINGEWVVDIHVTAFPYFAWGCNKLRTEIRGSFKEVVRHYLMVLLNQLSERGADNKNEVLSVLKGNLE